MGVSSRKGGKSRAGDEIGNVRGAVNGICLGGIGIQRGDGTATSLIGSAGAGSTGSAQGVGVVAGVGGARGVVTVEVLPSTLTDFAAKGEGTNELICPLAAKRGGIEIQSFSAFGVIIG